MSERPKGLMSLSEAARWLGMEGRRGRDRLLYYLRKVEADTGKRVLLRVGSGGRTFYRVTPRVIGKHAPELIPERERLPKPAAKAVRELRAELERAHNRIDDLEAILFGLGEKLRKGRSARG
jgi:hypothetical protein